MRTGSYLYNIAIDYAEKRIVEYWIDIKLIMLSVKHRILLVGSWVRLICNTQYSQDCVDCV